MTLINALGQTNTGVTVLTSNNTFEGVASTQSGQILQANSTSTGYSFVNPYQSLPTGGYINETVTNIGLAPGNAYLTTFPVANATNPISTTPYNAAAQCVAIPFTPTVTGSTIIAIVNVSIQLVEVASAQSAFTLVYLNGTGTPLFGNYLSGPWQVTSPKVAGLFGGIVGTNLIAGTTYDLNVCLFRLTAAVASPLGPYGNSGGLLVAGDYVKIIEYLPATNTAAQANPASPVQMITTTNTGQLIANFFVPNNSFLVISGQWAAFDYSTSLTGNGGNFTLMAQCGTGAPTIINNSAIENSILGAEVAPYIYFQVSGANNQLSLYGVGNGTNTYIFTVSFSLN